MRKVYDPKNFEDRIYEEWMEKGYFRPEVDKNKKPYTIVMPPPNVTGNLHMGHALNNTLQDILIRYKRMSGYSALWVPGTDHASISTEAKVVEKIKKDGNTKEILGREGFLEEAWAWTEEYGGNIKNQLKKIGISCDWSRERFTLDEELSNAVKEVFIRLYEKGLIYRGDRIINWCPSCRTAISDAEVEYDEQDGKIWTFRYPIENQEDFLSISTTRPETIPGDLGVAVNPEDERYRDLIGKYVILPVMDRKIPIVADSYVDMDFGTGAVKITPSHDPNDFEVGERHNLGQLLIMDDQAILNENAGKYKGLGRYEARKAIIQDFDQLGLFVKEENHHNSIGHCERCKTVIEPILSKQWFVEMKPLAEPALEAYKNGEVDFIPERFGKIYTHWLENIRDWCISRQLWWGHRIPVYYCDDCNEVIVSRDEPEACSKCNSKNLRQDEDTLDTWFSSALWPFSTLGWPNKTEDLEYFYPTDVLVTGYDIIFFWVIRMVFSAIELTDQVPFQDVYLTGLVRDEQGRKMSKSLGNGIDPLDVIAEYGADALRFTLVTGNSAGGDMRFTLKRVESNRNFANKLWNASRFVLMNLPEEMKDFSYKVEDLKTEDKWILHQASQTIKSVESKIDKYDIGLAADDIHDFIWEDYCDWYIELVKPRLYGEDTKDREIVFAVLVEVLETILKLLHPFMPYITEEIWAYLPNRKSALIVSQWPNMDSISFDEEKKELEYIQTVVRGIRNAKAEMDIEPHKKSQLYVLTQREEIAHLFEKNQGHLVNLGNITETHVISKREELSEDAISVVVDGAEIFLPMRDLVDYEKELERLLKDEEKTNSEIKRAEKKLANENFVSKAKPQVVEQEREKLNKYKEMLKNIEERLEFVRSQI